MSTTDIAERYLLTVRRRPEGAPSGTLRAVDAGVEQAFDGWIGLIGLMTRIGRTDMDHATTMRTAYERISAADLDGFAALVADDFVEHEEIPGLPPTKAGMLEYFRALSSAFPDLRMRVDDLITQDDKAVARVTASAHHDGDFMGVPASGAQVEMQLIDIMRFDEAGLVAEHWGVADMMSLMSQIGTIDP